MKILGVETSCDETAISLIDARGDFGSDFEYKVLGNALLSQVKVHEKYGGVFPNVAKREHGRNLVPIMGEVLRQAGFLDIPSTVSESDILALKELLEREPDLYGFLSSFLRSTGKPPIDAIAVTVGPGLEPALWVGINFARALSKVWDVPIVPVNHMEGHIISSALLARTSDMHDDSKNKLRFPLVSLLISGGHTELVLSEQWMQYKLLGQTRDDAVGEAFDKVARLMGLPYPGGPEISRIADSARTEKIEPSVSLPRPMIDTEDYDFSFSGLKTAVRRLVETNQPLTDQLRKGIAREFEDTVSDVLVAKLMRALDEYNAQSVLVGGGVSANTHIRLRIVEALKDYGSGATLLLPPPEYATDNALMIALAGYFRALQNAFSDGAALIAKGNLSLA